MAPGRRILRGKSQKVKASKNLEDNSNEITSSTSIPPPTPQPTKVLSKRQRDHGDDGQNSNNGKKSTTQMKDALEGVGVSIAPKTTRDRLLSLLDRHVTRKKQKRTCRKDTPPQAPTAVELSQAEGPLPTTNINTISSNENTTMHEGLTHTQGQANYSKFDDTFLATLLRGVGLDCNGMERETLIKNCQIYDELIVLPATAFREAVVGLQSPKTSIGLEAAVKDFTFSLEAPVKDFTFSSSGLSNINTTIHQNPPSISNQNLASSTPADPSRDLDESHESHVNLTADSRPVDLTSDSIIITDPVSSQSDESRISQLPSREHRRSLISRPHPTNLQAASSSRPSSLRKSKGKGKQIDHSERLPEASASTAKDRTKEIPTLNTSPEPAATEANDDVPDEGFDNFGSNFNSNSPSNLATWISRKINLALEDHKKKILDLQQDVVRYRKAFEDVNGLLKKTEMHVKILQGEVQSMKTVLKKFVEDEGGNTPVKTRGGRTAAHIRFHIDTLLGTKDVNDKLPDPARDDEKNGWARERDLNTIGNSHIPNNESDAGNVDPSFPYPAGPGHVNSTPQQLAIMWHMMQEVGVSSFRPDWPESHKSGDNKWLWELALKIFIKLVDCGEYPGISLEVENREYVEKCMHTYVQSLCKRYRQENMDDQRKDTMSREARRNARLRHLKKLRERIILSDGRLWCLSEAVEKACSDDETEEEGSSSGPCRVRNLPWRSLELGCTMEALDQYRSKITQSIPKNSQGRPPRPRVRDSVGPSSPMKIPKGLSKDCYNSQWIDENLSAFQKSQLKIQPTCILAGIIPMVNSIPVPDVYTPPTPTQSGSRLASGSSRRFA